MSRMPTITGRLVGIPCVRRMTIPTNQPSAHRTEPTSCFQRYALNYGQARRYSLLHKRVDSALLSTETIPARQVHEEAIRPLTRRSRSESASPC